MLSDEQLLRYNRQVLMNDFDIAGQERLARAKVLVLGLGGLGCPAALYLAAAGVGELVLVDGDVVELSNLQRQIAHGDADIGHNKARSVAASIAALNPGVKVTVAEQHADEAALQTLLAGVDLALDCTDNYPARFALNRACIEAGTPMLSAAAVRAEGQLALFDPVRGGPCYRCLYDETGDDTALSCSESGVLAPIVGVIGSMQALEAIKILADYGQTLRGKLMLLDLKTADVRKFDVSSKSDCPACGHLKG